MTSIRADPPPYVDQYDRPACLPAQLGSPAKGPSDYDYEEDERLPLGFFLMDKIWNGTVGTISIDLKRPIHPPKETRAMHNIFTVSRPQAGLGRARGRQYNQRAPVPGQVPRDDLTAIPGFAFEDTGARIKAMRHIQFGAKYDEVKYGHVRKVPTFDLGFGGSFQLDTAEFTPSLRLKFRDFVSFKVMPRPGIKLQKRFELGTSGYGLRVSYECPLEDVDHFWEPPARLLVSLDNTIDTGMRITQNGLEFAANKWLLNDAVRVRALGIMSMPTELPVEQGEQWVNFDVKRLGIKARW